MPVHEKKLRQVLDYWPCETCLEHPSSEQEYLCSVCSRLTRTIALSGPTGMPRPEDAPIVLDASDDALRKFLLTPDEWAKLTGEAVVTIEEVPDEEAEREVDLVDAVHDLGDRVYPLERLDEEGLLRFEEEEPDEVPPPLAEDEWDSEAEPEVFEPTWEKEDEPPEPLPGSEASELAEKISRLAQEVRSMGESGSSVSPEGRTQGGTTSMAAKRKKAKRTKARKSPAKKKAGKKKAKRTTKRKTAKKTAKRRTVGKRRKTAKKKAKRKAPKRKKAAKKGGKKRKAAKKGGKKKAKRKTAKRKK